MAISTVYERGRFLRQTKSWSDADSNNFTDWLLNFKKEEDLIFAKFLLDNLNFISSSDFTIILKHVLTKIFAELLYHHGNGFQKDIIFSSIPGEDANITDSGTEMLRIVKTRLGFQTANFQDPKDLRTYLSKQNSSKIVIFIDDFVGTGNQVAKAWSESHYMESFSSIQNGDEHDFYLGVAVANERGIRRIKKECNGLKLFTTYSLNDSYKINDPKFMGYGENDALRSEVPIWLKEFSQSLGIADTGGLAEDDYLGFCQQALLLGFEHGTPDATLPILYFKSKEWSNLLNGKHIEAT